MADRSRPVVFPGYEGISIVMGLQSPNERSEGKKDRNVQRVRMKEGEYRHRNPPGSCA